MEGLVDADEGEDNEVEVEEAEPAGILFTSRISLGIVAACPVEKMLFFLLCLLNESLAASSDLDKVSAVVRLLYLRMPLIL